MESVVLGAVYSEPFAIGASGLTFSRDASYVANVSTSWSPTFTEVGSTGTYRVTYTTAALGAHEWIGHSSAQHNIAVTFNVISAAADPAALATAIATVQTGVDANAALWTSARAAKVDRIGSSTTVTSAGTLTDGARLEIRRGDAYLGAESNAKQWTYTGGAFVSAVLELSTFAGVLVLQKPVTRAGDVLSADLTSAETAALALGTPIYRYEIIATLSGGGPLTLVSGDVWIAD